MCLSKALKAVWSRTLGDKGHLYCKALKAAHIFHPKPHCLCGMVWSWTLRDKFIRDICLAVDRRVHFSGLLKILDLRIILDAYYCRDSCSSVCHTHSYTLCVCDYLAVSVSVSVSICLSFFLCLCIDLSDCLSASVFVSLFLRLCLTVCLSVSFSFCVSLCLSLPLSLFLSLSLFFSLSLSLSLSNKES